MITIAIVAIGGTFIAYALHRGRQERQEAEVDRDLRYFDNAAPPGIPYTVPYTQTRVLDPWTLNNQLAAPPEYHPPRRTS